MAYTTNITRINYLAASKMIAAAVARADERRRVVPPDAHLL